MPQKSRIAAERKIEAVERYLRSEIGATEIVQELDITESTLRRWVILYKAYGPEGLVPQAKNRKYSPELKHAVVQEYSSGKNSAKGLCLQYSVSDEHIVRRWIKRYNVMEILNSNFSAEKLSEKWLTDVTELKYCNGDKLYLSAILDLKDKSIVSYAIGRSNNNQLVFDTFDIAVQKYPDAKPLLHSDRGYQ